MKRCKCGSYAINPGRNDRSDTVDLDLCDVCFWKKRAMKFVNKNFNCKEIIIEKLNQIGADGLCNTDLECGCSKDEICLMESDFSKCVPAKLSDCPNKNTQCCVDCVDSCEGCTDGPVYREFKIK